MKLSELIMELAGIVSVQGDLECGDKFKVSVSKNKSVTISKLN